MDKCNALERGQGALIGVRSYSLRLIFTCHFAVATFQSQPIEFLVFENARDSLKRENSIGCDSQVASVNPP